MKKRIRYEVATLDDLRTLPPDAEKISLGLRDLRIAEEAAGLKRLRDIEITDFDEASGALPLHLFAGIESLYLLAIAYLRDKHLESLVELRSLANLGLDWCAGPSDRTLDGICAMDSIRHVSLFACYGMTRDGIGRLLKHGGLVSVDLGETGVSDSDLALAFASGIESFRLRNTGITDAAFLSAGDSHRLRNIDLADCRITDAAVESLVNCPTLEDINLTFCRSLTDRTLSALLKATGLKSVHLVGCKQITASALSELSGLEGLEALDLAMTQVDDAAIRKLSGLEALEYLDLFKCRRITAESLPYLEGFRKLRRVRISGTTILERFPLESVREAYPRIEWF